MPPPPPRPARERRVRALRRLLATLFNRTPDMVWMPDPVAAERPELGARDMKSLPVLLRTPGGTMFAVGSIALVVEFLIMLLIEGVSGTFVIGKVPNIFLTFIDPLLLTALLSPILYVLIFRPTREQQAELERLLVELRRKEQLTALIEAIPDAVFLKDGEGRWLLINESATQMFQLHDIPWQGKTDMELADLHPAFRAAYEGCLVGDEKAWQAGHLLVDEEIVAGEDGRSAIIETRKVPIFGEEGERRGLAIIGRDITERRDAERFDEFRRRILERLAASDPLHTVLEALVLGIEQLDPAMLCSILLLDSEGKHLGQGVAPSLPDFYNAAINGIEIGMGVGSCGTAAFTGKPVIVADIATHPYWAPYKELAARAGLGACWSQPVIGASGQVLGTFAIYHHEAHTPAEFDLGVIEQSARLASIAIEKSITAEKLRGAEERYRKLFKDAPYAIALADAETGLILDLNQAFSNLLGWERTALIGKPQRLLHPDVGDAAVSSSFEQHRSHGSSSKIETRAITRDGRVLDMAISATVLDLEGRKVVLGLFQDITERKQAEAEMRIAATAFESQEGMLITDAHRVILRVNHAFTTITGYTAEEVIGKNPRLLSSGRQDADFYVRMWDEVNNTGSWQDEIWDRRKNGEIYPAYLTITSVKDAKGIIANYVATFTDSSADKAAAEAIQSLAFYDPLTHLPNRRLLLDRLNQALVACTRSGQSGALLFLDLDHFKTLNDTLGHDCGDLLLQQVAQRLSACVRESDTVARLGGDEFVVMLEGLSESALEAAAETESIGHKILAALHQPYQLGAQPHHSSASIGATLFSGHQAGVGELLKQADMAMYQAKNTSRNTLRFFDPQMQHAIDARASVESELRQALAKQQFHLHYQVQVDSSYRPVGAEALIRWLHPERGLVPPMQFMPLAEETGLILPIGQWVLETACAQLREWQQARRTRDLTLSINVSALQFRQADFVAQVQAALQRHGVQPARLKLELTESLLLDHIPSTIASMVALRELGVQFSLDDFGTGYSSLQYLKRLPLDQLKIDQSFVRDLAVDSGDQTIVRTIIAMAHSLNLNVTAEGVETEAQRQFLLNEGCTDFQGYLFGNPVPIDQFEALLA